MFLLPFLIVNMLLFLDSLIYEHIEIINIIKETYDFGNMKILKGDRCLGIYKLLNSNHIGYYKISPKGLVGLAIYNAWDFDE